MNRDSLLSEEIGAGPTDTFLGHSLISLHGDEHFERRRLESRLFRKAARARLELEVVLPALHDLLDSCLGGAADLMIFSRLILIRASAAVVGVGPVEDLPTADRLRVQAENIANAISVDWHTDNQDAIMQLGLESRDAFKRDFYAPAARASTRGHRRAGTHLASCFASGQRALRGCRVS